MAATRLYSRARASFTRPSLSIRRESLSGKYRGRYRVKAVTGA